MQLPLKFHWKLRSKDAPRGRRVPLLPWCSVQRLRMASGDFRWIFVKIARQDDPRQAAPLPYALGTAGRGEAGTLFSESVSLCRQVSTICRLTSHVVAVRASRHDPTAARPGKSLGLSRSSSRRLARSSCVCDASTCVLVPPSLPASLVLLLGERRCCAGGLSVCGKNAAQLKKPRAKPGGQGSWTEKFCDLVRRHFRSYSITSACRAYVHRSRPEFSRTMAILHSSWSRIYDAYPRTLESGLSKAYAFGNYHRHWR